MISTRFLLSLAFLTFWLSSSAHADLKGGKLVVKLRAKAQNHEAIAGDQAVVTTVAEKLGVDESRISDILRGKIDGFTLDRLVSYAEELYPKLKVKISAA